MELSRTEISKLYNISKNDWLRKKDQVLSYLAEYMEIREIVRNGRYFYEVDKVPENIPKMPKKSCKEERMKEYEKFVQDYLPEEAEILTKYEVAADALESFGEAKFGHHSVESVLRSYVSPLMNKHGVQEKYCWCWYNPHKRGYEPAPEDIVNEWRQLLSIAQINKDTVFNAFANAETLGGQAELQCYKDAFGAALDTFKMHHHGKFLVRYAYWRKKTDKEMKDYMEKVEKIGGKG